MSRFQFTHPCGCDSYTPTEKHRSNGFNSRTRVGATILCPRLSSPNRCFNSRTRVGATGFQGFLHILVPVSIHAPVWVRPRATPLTASTTGFQFTHPCGCDVPDCSNPAGHRSFNSRTRVGATEGALLMAGESPVSIHAPVWVRLQDGRSFPLWGKFQFTHPCGCDAGTGNAGRRGKCFNSRTRVGATA